MTEKIGLIKNPLTIIAIFAGIAEVSGTIVLPFIAAQNQELFICFLIFFPSILVVLFFLTLNFNNKVLYAPSDYKDEQNYIKINRYDLSSQRNVEFKVLKSATIDPQFITLNERLEQLNDQISKIQVDAKRLLPNKPDKTGDLELLVSNFINASDFVNKMSIKGYSFKIYHSPFDKVDGRLDFTEHKNYSLYSAIWLGTLVKLEAAKEIITTSKEFYPHLDYIHLEGDHEPYGRGKYVYIGGATETSKNRFHLRQMSNADFEKINTFDELDKLHAFIRSFY